MVQKEVMINNQHGLHTRPAALFVKAAKSFKSDITITYNNVTVNAKSLFKIQTLGLVKGTIITLTASGLDEQKAIDHLVNIIKTL
ncbi:HPr family phosphocarrier protein [Enterobacteriaceae endosymbiont of Neohaemonia nigricornis]|uniref:HPr family phosphocarrier protein n=1 Tax=Enterobacteriaceae endosymbiont of Neohaemonia nigricornis TaxID=2675792 RepID=UPI001449F7A5|nr:HPr family phosphocarrier protein [Enterobacteriaceae endosymbiont of Neohaemonia nigricornis]QJC30585.1 HPr family phosphocarrier protein [Enterobacteriaceae endosymbiont of Neohaemonia nigricornis]